MNAYSQANQQQLMKDINKCMDNMQYSTCYTITSMLYLHMINDKYIEIYNEFISQLQIYAKAIRIIAKGYLPISLITPQKLQEILNSVKETLN